MQHWIGDQVLGQTGILGNKIIASMSTAIVRTYTPEGFIIAADGKALGSLQVDPVSDTVQKIFPIGGRAKKTIAYALSGTVSLMSKDSTGTAFSFAEELARFTQTISASRFDTLKAYAKKVCGVMHRTLKEAKEAGDLDYPECTILDAGEYGSTIAKIFIDGYHKGRPERVQVRFFHDRQTLEDLEVLNYPLFPGAPNFHGSTIIADIMLDSTSDLFKSYSRKAVELVHHGNETLCIYAQMAHAYINACSGPEASVLDPQGCASIGGCIHIAVITSKTGFEWVLEPKPK